MLKGDTIRRIPSIFSGVSALVDERGNKTSTALPCVVIYIHPERRFYTVRFKLSGGSFCESYTFAGK
ncbi:MAG: hypothetical protein RR949_01495 [Oscillospiraceae bacterium]